MKKVISYAPASIGNLSVGFDLLGIALKPIDNSLLGDEVVIEESKSTTHELVVEGDYVHVLPQDVSKNIVYSCLQYFSDLGNDESKIRVTLRKNLPIGSGLGSSASSVVAALTALNYYYNNILSDDQLLQLMGQFEGQLSGSIHYDNITPSYYGGLQLSKNQKNITIPHFNHWYWVLAYSGVEIMTSTMRSVLPDTVSFNESILFAQNLAYFIAASFNRNEQEALSVIKDNMIEPVRAPLIPQFNSLKSEFKRSFSHAVLGISGSGPTVFAIALTLEEAKEIEQLCKTYYLKNDSGFTKICQVDSAGAQVKDM